MEKKDNEKRTFWFWKFWTSFELTNNICLKEKQMLFSQILQFPKVLNLVLASNVQVSKISD